MRAVHFGAGNIGRGFIGLALAESGFAVTFVDVDARIVDALNQYGAYPVQVIGASGHEERIVRNVRALHVRQEAEIVEAIAHADIVTTAVGKSALPHLASMLASGLAQRSDPVPVIVIACENVLGNSAYLEELVLRAAGPRAIEIQAVTAFPNCVVDRIVPTRVDRAAHPLLVAVEEYAQWAIDASALPRMLPIRGAEYCCDLDVILAQKLCTLNMAHAIVGYYGYLRGHTYVHEAMGDDDIRQLLEGALTETGRVLTATFAIPAELQTAYATRVIGRLENPALHDAVTRVAREPQRKLGAADRLVFPAQQAVAHGIVPAHLATGIAAALAYDAPQDGEARALRRMVEELGVRTALRTVAGIPEQHVLLELVHASAHFGALRVAT